MPVIYRCRDCGAVLHVFEYVGQDFYGVPSPSEVALWRGGFCPKCGHKIGAPRPEDIHIRYVSRKTLREIMDAVKREYMETFGMLPGIAGVTGSDETVEGEADF